MTTWSEYINQVNTDFDQGTPIFSAVSIGTGMVLNGNLRQSSGQIQAAGLKLDSVSLSTVQTSSESFADNNTSIMTSAAIADKIEAYGYSTTTGDITGVTAGTGLSGGGASGAVTLNVSGVTLSELDGAAVITSSESFADNDTTVMTSAAIQDKIEAYGYTTATGDITGVTAGTGLSGGGPSGAVTLNVSGLTVSEFAGASIQTGSESFADNDTTLMTSAAIQDKILSYSYITGVTNIAGNAATATALETARNIGGVSFDGTGNIDLAGVNTGGNQDTSGNAATATALETARNIGGVSFNGTANIDLAGVNTAGNQDTSGNAATATALATARAINGVDFDGTGAITVTADANTLSNTTLKSSVVNSSLTSVGTLSSLSTGDITLNGTAITSTADELNILDGSGTSWTEGTPTWGGITVGNASVNTIRHIVIGKVCVAQFRFVFGSTTSVTSTVSLAPPVNADYSHYQIAGTGWFYDVSGGKIHQVQCVVVSSTLIYFYAYYIASGNYSFAGGVGPTTPATSWNTSDNFYGQIVYRLP